ncbi:hypothetical protein, partial [Gluconobacter sp. Dm-44]|uniref:hypothetical protein n=1 Tax=Gluconobacter sp. Dm-44 TaxID=2799805 RepID=UPI001B8AD031
FPQSEPDEWNHRAAFKTKGFFELFKSLISNSVLKRAENNFFAMVSVKFFIYFKHLQVTKRSLIQLKEPCIDDNLTHYMAKNFSTFR